MLSGSGRYLDRAVVGRFRRHAAVLLVIWTVLIAASAFWNVFQLKRDTVEKARIEARTILEHNIAYRRWNSAFGGVYVAVGGAVQPNPYIVHPRRDLTATDGTRLTLVNPFQMTKQAYALLHEQSPHAAVNRTVSLRPTNPENEPDAWEAAGLREFEQGAAEVSGLTTIDSRAYVRVLRPYVTYAACLECHGSQGYSLGDIRGGMSIAVPMEPYLAAQRSGLRTMIGTHIAIWIAGMAGIALWMRNIRQQQLQTAESEWKLRTLSDNTQDWQYWITEDHRIVHMTPSCERITGYPVQAFVEDPGLVTRIIHPEDREAYERHLRGDMMRPVHEEIDFRIITRGGQTRRLFHVCGPIYQGDAMLGRHVSNRDVTDRRQLEEQLQQAQKMESLGLFVGGIAHDFNNILTVITGYAGFLQSSLAAAGESVQKQLQDMATAAFKARSLISSLLAFGRKQVMRRSTIKLNSVIDTLAKLLKRIIGEDIELQIRCSAVEFPIYADQHQIEQVIMNLMTNARDAMPFGGRLVIATEPMVVDPQSAERLGITPGRYMQLSVRDEGVGIDEKDLEHIFDPFFTTKEASKGTGLGLAMVYGIIKQHEGVIRVESAKGTGTTFRILFPESRADDMTALLEPSAAEALLRGKGTLLLVEDDDMVRRFLQDILEANGYTVIAAADGEAALAEVRNGDRRIDGAVIDLVLPRLSGWELYDQARQVRAGLRALFISGYGPEELAAKGLVAGSITVFPKPIDVEKLLIGLRELVSS